MAPTPSPTEHRQPPLLALPTELKLHIITYLYVDQTPNLACLRRTHTSFRDIIPKSDVRSTSPAPLLRHQLLDAELNYPYLLPVDHYPCYKCTAVLPVQDFHPYLVQCNLAIGGACAYNRFCNRCGYIHWTTEQWDWKIEGQEHLALQPIPVERRAFENPPLPHGTEPILQAFFDDYWVQDLTSRFTNRFSELSIGFAYIGNFASGALRK